jgi:polysaccharide export outer membrane protein
MKLKFNSLNRCGLLLALPLLALVLGGCSLFSSHTNKGLMDPPSEESGLAGSVARLHVGDTVIITFSGLPEDLPPQEKPIKEDGTITLPDIGRVKASGKTPGELEDAIHDLYVPLLYRHLTVTVKTSGDRVYFVRGEVKSPGRMLYTGSITVSRAIASAGDFTDFADRGSVYLTRADGRRFALNLKRIMAGKDPDPPVYPGDQIEVTRRIF